MGILNSKQEAQERIQILRDLKQSDFESALNKLNDLSKRQCKLLLSKWDLQLILKLSAIQVKKVMLLINKNKDLAQINVHQLVLTMILSTPHLNQQQKIQNTIQSICFELDNSYIHMGDIEYLFSLAYYLIHMVSDLQLNSSQTQKNLMKELFKSSSGNQQQNTENVEMSKLTQFLDSNEDVQNLILLMCNSFTQQTNRIEFSNLTSQNSQNPMSGNFSTKNNFVKKVAVGSANILNQVMQQRNARQNEIMNTVGGDNEKIQNENDSLANYSQINGANATVENNQQRLDSMRASEMNEGFTQRDNLNPLIITIIIVQLIFIGQSGNLLVQKISIIINRILI